MRARVDGQFADGLPLDDRGLAYGDGVFETVLIHAGEPVWWEAHLQRLARGAAVLGIAVPDPALWHADLRALFAETAGTTGVLKLILTRGGGARGYRASTSLSPRRIALAAPLTDGAAKLRLAGVRLRWCSTRLSAQPRLAGIKHLNRLEQVLARAEWNDPTITEGVMLDFAGRVVCATAGNVFAYIDGRWRTPPLSDCGIAGVCRQQLMEIVDIEPRGLSPAELLVAAEVFVCNSLRGILPVIALEDRQWPIGDHTRRLQRLLAQSVPAFNDVEHSA